MNIIENVNRLEDYLINESEISLIDIQKISTYLTNIREEAINYTRCSTQLKHDDFAIGEKVWMNTKKIVEIDTFCEDGTILVEDAHKCYKVNKQELHKVV